MGITQTNKSVSYTHLDVYKRQALQEYHFSWEHIKGTNNKVPDTLSRVDVIDNKTGRDLKEIEIFRLTREDRIFGEELREIKSMQRSENKLGKIIASLEAHVNGCEYNTHFQIYQGILFKKVEGVNVIGD